MTNQISRRRVLQGISALPLAGSFSLSPRAALAQSTTLTAAITGYNVINSLDPAKASLIPEFYVIWGVFNGLMTFDDEMNIVPDLAETVTPLEGGRL